MNQSLAFRDDGTFTIVQFTDLHWHDGSGLDRRTASLMDLVLDAERPELVVLTGDVLQGAECLDPAAAWRQAVEPMESRSIPWAAVFGNHDDEGSLDRRELLAVQQSCRMCLSQAGPENIPGVGNYILPIRSRRQLVIDGESSSPPAMAFDSPGSLPARSQANGGHFDRAAILYFIDSGSYAADGDGYAAISAEQIDWFLSISAHDDRDVRRTVRRSIPALAFLHIPLPEFARAGQAGSIRGFHLEAVQCPQANTGFFDAARSVGVIGIFAGHDHLNDFDADWQGVRLCFGRSTGYRGYGRDDFVHGARVIRLIEGERRFQTWLRLEDGSAVSQGQDQSNKNRSP